MTAMEITIIFLMVFIALILVELAAPYENKYRVVLTFKPEKEQ